MHTTKRVTTSGTTVDAAAHSGDLDALSSGHYSAGHRSGSKQGSVRSTDTVKSVIKCVELLHP
jgi:hypothetical protein